jgi:hypothetical protein
MRCRTALLVRSDLTHDPVLAGPGAAVTVCNGSGCPYNEITILLAPSSPGPAWPTRYTGTLWPLRQRQNPARLSHGSVKPAGGT